MGATPAGFLSNTGEGGAGTRPLHQGCDWIPRPLEQVRVWFSVELNKATRTTHPPVFWRPQEAVGTQPPAPSPPRGFNYGEARPPDAEGRAAGRIVARGRGRATDKNGGAGGMGYGMGDDLGGGFMSVVPTSQKCRLQISGILQ